VERATARANKRQKGALAPEPPAAWPTRARTGGRRPAAFPGAFTLAGLAW
jgi:hypothetical protein